MLTRTRTLLATLVSTALVITGCTTDQTPADSRTSGKAVEATLSEDGLSLTLNDIVVTVPASAAPMGTLVRVALEAAPTEGGSAASGMPDTKGATAVSEAISVTLGDDLQPAAPIRIEFPVDVQGAEQVTRGEAALVMRSVSQDGAVSLTAGDFDEASTTYTTQTSHLSWFSVFKIDLGAAVAEAKTAVLQGIGLEYPEPECTADVARIAASIYAPVQPPQSWLCVSDKTGALTVTAHPNSVIPFVLTSPQATELRTDSTEIGVTTPTMLWFADKLGFIGSGRAAVMPGTTATASFSGSPQEVTLTMVQYPALMLMAILATTVDTVFGWFGISNRITEALDGLQCLADVVKVAPPGSTFNGESAGALTRAFFSCAGTVGGDIISNAGKVILSIVAAAPGFLAGSALGIINEFTGEARKTVALDVTPAARPAASPIALAPGGRLSVSGTDVSDLPAGDALRTLAGALGDPDETTAVGQACDTHESIGYAVRWDNFRVLVQTEDNPYDGGNARKGRIVGWELNGWSNERLEPSPTLNGVGLGSTLAAARSAFPAADEGEGDGTWVLFLDVGQDIFAGASMHFEDDSPTAEVAMMDSGYACGS